MATASPDFIHADGLYSLADVRRLMSLGPAALRTARHNGLIVKRIGRCSFIKGSDLIKHFDEHGKVVA